MCLALYYRPTEYHRMVFINQAIFTSINSWPSNG